MPTRPRIPLRSSFVILAAASAALFVVGASAVALAGVSSGSQAPSDDWRLDQRSGKGGEAIALYAEKSPVAGRPSFLLETSLSVPPAVAHRLLVDNLLDPSAAPSGQTRRILERSENGAVVHTFIDLPVLLADREVALRVVHEHDTTHDVHRVVWHEANEVLPPAADGIVRLKGAEGYWEFRPDGQGGTKAVHLTRTEIGGSFPAALGDRLMRAQAVESVEKFRARVASHVEHDVAAGPPR